MINKPYRLRYVCFAAAPASLSASPSRADGYAENRDKSLGVEVNILWPFRTYEGKRHNQGTMDSHAMLLGARAALFGTNASLEYTAWLCKDRFAHENGNTYSGYSYANEFYLGYAYYPPGLPAYVLP